MKSLLRQTAWFVSAAILMSPAVGAQAADKLIYGVFWRGCEEVCQGFQDYVSEAGIDAEVVIRNAEQDKSKLPDFRKEAREMRADLILTWGTSATLGIAGTLDDVGDPSFNGDIAHVFTVVADPVGAGIVGSLEKTNRANVTGTYNRVPETVNINAIRSYDPGFRRLGLLYNANEPNSLLKRDEIAALATDMGFELVAIELPLAAGGKPRVEDIPIKLTALKDQGVDFIYLGSSSFLDKNRDLFTGAAVDLGLSILSPYERLVRDAEALFSIAARYYDVGRLAGAQAEKILVDGERPGDIPVARMTEFAYVVNMEVARRLNRYPPLEILQFAETVN
jgi:putative ABC transport system substrate-binding protein